MFIHLIAQSPSFTQMPFFFLIQLFHATGVILFISELIWTYRKSLIEMRLKLVKSSKWMNWKMTMGNIGVIGVLRNHIHTHISRHQTFLIIKVYIHWNINKDSLWLLITVIRIAVILKACFLEFFTWFKRTLFEFNKLLFIDNLRNLFVFFHHKCSLYSNELFLRC